MRRWLLVTFAAEAFWSSSWWSMPFRRAPRPSNGIWLATTTIGTPVAYASCNPARDVNAPGPVERNSTPTSPVAREYPSAANAELFSTREDTK
ncbi:hypothetical protein AHiyo8_21220 [Arthrobacter sp. Hiyo8]|nr:hypothetical protein AHiyo8_21220 [Arthrobacter sp. Hiyo8]